MLRINSAPAETIILAYKTLAALLLLPLSNKFLLTLISLFI